MVTIQILWFISILIEIARNCVIIADKKRRPKYWWSNIIRCAYAAVFWYVSVLLADLNVYHQWGLIVMMFFTAWWTFDYGLNFVRNYWPGSEFNKSFDYINHKGSWLDQLQCRFNLRFLFWMKLLFMFIGVQLYWLGVQVIWTGSW